MTALVMTTLAWAALGGGLALGAWSTTSAPEGLTPVPRALAAAEAQLATQPDGPAIAGVAELQRLDGYGTTTDALAYTMLTSENSFDWPEGAGEGGAASGVTKFVLPRLARSDLPAGVSTRLAIANLVTRPGFTDFGIYLYDQNGILDFVCSKLNEDQVEYIDLATWGYVNRGWVGSAVVSAEFWEHDVFDPAGGLVRNLVGLAGVSVEVPSAQDGAPGGVAAGAAAVPLLPGTGAIYGPAEDLCAYARSAPWFPPTPTPTATVPHATATSTSTPTPTPTPEVAPPYAPLSPEVSLPALAELSAGSTCSATLRIQNVGLEPARAVLVTWDGTSQASAGCAPPSAVVCSGPIGPGSALELEGQALPAGAESGTLFSVTSGRLSDIGVVPGPGTSDSPVADYLCNAASQRVVGTCYGYVAFKQAYDTGADYLGAPMDRALGSPLVVQVGRTCQDAQGINHAALSTYEGASGLDLGYAAPGELFTYALPHLAALDGGRSSVVHLQNAGDSPANVRLDTYSAGPGPTDCLPPVPCTNVPIAPGKTVSVDMAICRRTAFEGAGLVTSSVPLGVVVDDLGPGTLASYTAGPASRREMHGQPVLAAANRVTFAPLLYKNWQGWSSRLHVQNLGPGTAALKVVLLDRSGDVVATSWYGPLCEGETRTIDLEAIAGVPYAWLGTARVESYAQLPPEAVPWTPAPTSTPWATAGAPPTATPCTGTCPPTVPPTPTPTFGAGATSTPLAGPTSTPPTSDYDTLYLPGCLDRS